MTKRGVAWLAGCVLLSVSTTALADFVLSGRSSVVAMSMNAAGREALSVRDHLMRRDLTDRGRAYSYIYDLKRKEIILLDHLMRTAQVQGLKAHTKASTPANLKLTLEPTGRTAKLGDWNCEEQNLAASMPTEMGQEKVKVVLEGTLWLERKASERKELAPFVRAIDTDDFFVGAQTPGKPAPPQGRVFNEVIRKILQRGMVCAADVQFKYEGGGPMADLARRMATRAGMAYETLEDGDLKTDIFTIPAGYHVERN